MIRAAPAKLRLTLALLLALAPAALALAAAPAPLAGEPGLSSGGPLLWEAAKRNLVPGGAAADLSGLEPLGATPRRPGPRPRCSGAACNSTVGEQ